MLNSRAQESDDDEDQIAAGPVAVGGGEGESEDAGGIARELAARFHDLRTCSELVARHGAALQRSLVDLEVPPTDTTKQVSERATLFRISCNAMMNVSNIIKKGKKYYCASHYSCLFLVDMSKTIKPSEIKHILVLNFGSIEYNHTIVRSTIILYIYIYSL